MSKMRPASEVFTPEERNWLAGGMAMICVLSLVIGTVAAIVR